MNILNKYFPNGLGLWGEHNSKVLTKEALTWLHKDFYGEEHISYMRVGEEQPLPEYEITAVSTVTLAHDKDTVVTISSEEDTIDTPYVKMKWEDIEEIELPEETISNIKKVRFNI